MGLSNMQLQRSRARRVDRFIKRAQLSFHDADIGTANPTKRVGLLPAAMRYSDPKDKSEELLRLAPPHIAQHGCGCQPPSYALWYEYVAGTNLPLKQALDARIAQRHALTAEETNTLYTTHIAARDALSCKPEAVHEALDHRT
jgi:hypothetical protein